MRSKAENVVPTITEDQINEVTNELKKLIKIAYCLDSYVDDKEN